MPVSTLAFALLRRRPPNDLCRPLCCPLFFSSASSTTHVLKVGDTLRLKRSFSDADVAQYSRLTGDSNPLHFDAEVAKKAGGFRGAIVHGLLVSSLFPALIATHFPGTIYISQSLQFKLPIYIEEEIVVEVQSLNLKVSRNRYVARFLTRCFKDEELALSGEALAVLPTLEYKADRYLHGTCNT